ncbi:hypothetical protein ASF70_12695 [Rhizobium sp. Leaf321]|uniref:hypothetical protein n=1 Tax=Rhizobium sp. Leaf321 TaxID=1736335 RepID=UPI000714534B|nr:hypothetical protein [Rhizobium sp. Leaf321]KQQ72386.1 hypothetical protein ASF70_12695 [Rhizobium sp. Leaf321]
MNVRILLPLIIVSALTGCQTIKEVPVKRIVERKVEVPKSLLSCSAEPVAGSVWITQRDVARYLVQLAAAGEDCRTKLAAVKRLVDAQ